MFDGLLTELSEEMAPFRSQVADAWQVRCALALARQRRIAAANARLRRRQIEGLGEVVASIDAELFWSLVEKQGADYRDPEFLAMLVRDNEELRVRCQPDKLTLRVDGLRDGRNRKDGSNEVAETEAVALEPNEFEETLTRERAVA